MGRPPPSFGQCPKENIFFHLCLPLMWSSRLLYMCTWLMICLEMGSCFGGKRKWRIFFTLSTDTLHALNSLWQDQSVWTVRSFGKSYILFMLIFPSLSLIVLGGPPLTNDEWQFSGIFQILIKAPRLLKLHRRSFLIRFSKQPIKDVAWAVHTCENLFSTFFISIMHKELD